MVLIPGFWAFVCFSVVIILALAIGLTLFARGFINNRNAKKNKNNALDVYNKAKMDLENAKKNAANSLENLGKLKLNVWDRQMGAFVKTVKQIKDVELTGHASLDELELANFTQEELKNIEISSLNAANTIKGGLASIGAGAAGSVAATTAATSIGVASTGTAIGALSGAAATSSTLAWLGGGSLAAGGLGVAGGTVVLGGIVLAPALAVGSVIYAAHSKGNLARSEQLLAEAKKAAAEMDNATSVLNSIKSVSDEYYHVITKLDNKMAITLSRLQTAIKETRLRERKLNEKGHNTVIALLFRPINWLKERIKPSKIEEYTVSYTMMTEEEKHLVHVSYLTAQIMKKILETPLLDSDGVLTPECKPMLENGKKYLEK